MSAWGEQPFITRDRPLSKWCGDDDDYDVIIAFSYALDLINGVYAIANSFDWDKQKLSEMYVNNYRISLFWGFYTSEMFYRTCRQRKHQFLMEKFSRWRLIKAKLFPLRLYSFVVRDIKLYSKTNYFLCSLGAVLVTGLAKRHFIDIPQPVHYSFPTCFFSGSSFLLLFSSSSTIFFSY